MGGWAGGWVGGEGGTVYPKGGQRVLGWDVRGGHCILGDRLSCYTGSRIMLLY